jgi:hypothetical protein
MKIEKSAHQKLVQWLQSYAPVSASASVPKQKASFLPDGVAPGSLMEVSGSPGGGKTELVLRFLSQNSHGRVAWVGEGLDIFPTALPQYGVSMDRVLFVEAPHGQGLWSAQQILRSGVFSFLVLQRPKTSWEEIVFRKLQLAAEKSQTTLIILSETPQKQGAWPISIQLQVRRRVLPRQMGVLDIEVIKCRGEKNWNLTLLSQSPTPPQAISPEALCQLA